MVKTQTLKLLASFAIQFELIIHHLDVDSAFLNADIISEVYVKQPEGYRDGTGRVWKLKKALYGLSESPKAWYNCIDEYLRSLGLIRSENDYCLYYLDHEEGDSVYVVIFVDDILVLCCKDIKKINHVKAQLSIRFSMKDLGMAKKYLGINIKFDYKHKCVSLDQEDYIESVARKFNTENSKLYSTPMEQNLKCKHAQSESNYLNYRNLIGCLLHISSATRPDISFSVNYLSRFQNAYDQTHYK